MKNAQRLATKIFITASILFGIVGITAIVSTPRNGNPAEWLMKTLGVLVFIILSSFAVSLALKYLTPR